MSAPGAPKVGLLGGTFDPPHAGHLAAARFALERFRLDRVELVPTCQPPHKPGRPLSPPWHRFAMAALAALGEERITASFRELERGGLSYTIDTLRQARAALPGSTIHFILGTDQFAELGSWREPDAILSEFALIVIGRPGAAFQEALAASPEAARLAFGEGRIAYGAMDPVDLSSTRIRALVHEGSDISGLVPPPVGRYIQAYQLYR